MSHTKTAIAGLNPETGICCYVGDQTEESLMEAISQGLIIVPVTPAQARTFFGEAFVISASPVDRDAQVTALRQSGLSIDGDNAYKRDLIDSIVGALTLGKQGVNPPPSGHWSQQFWDMGRAEGEEKERLINQRDAILLQARVWAGEAKTQQAITREVGDILGGVPNWGPIAAGVEALRQQALSPDRKWISITERMPQCGVTVLAFYVNSAGRQRRIRAEYIERWAVLAEDLGDPDSECVEYSESADAYYVLQGWYESIDNWPDYSRIAVIEGEVTHWARLPKAPIEQIP